MKKFILLLLILMSLGYAGLSQQNYYSVTAGEGYGIRLWGMDEWKIHMGNSSEYHFGPVQGYSVKSNALYPSSAPYTGWTWGSLSQTPVAALSVLGDMQIAGAFTTNYNLWVSGKSGLGIAESSIYTHARLHVKSPSAYQYAILSEALNNRKILSLGHDGTSGIISTTALDGSGFSPIIFQTGNLYRVTIKADGYVGIGTTSPSQLLTVNGTIYGKEVKVDLSVPGPDYVFEESYRLPALDEVKSYIDQNKHLPEVPSAKEMEKNGVNLGEMNMLLLKKVEELTLYVIEQQKRIVALEAANKNQDFKK